MHGLIDLRRLYLETTSQEDVLGRLFATQALRELRAVSGCHIFWIDMFPFGLGHGPLTYTLR